MNKNKTMLALAFVILAIAPASLVLMSGESEADLTIQDGVRGEGFASSRDGTLFVPIFNTEDVPIQVTLTVIIDGNDIRTFDVEVPGNGGTVELRFRIGGVGDHTIRVEGTPADLFVPNNYYDDISVHVSESVLDKPTTYIAIAVVAILIIIAAFLYMRNAPTKKPDTTFRELEQQKRASKGETDSAPKASATEKKRYDKASAAEPPKAAPKEKEPAPAEKKAATFTELEKEKTAKKEASTKKASSDEEPKKLKYVSSRRK